MPRINFTVPIRVGVALVSALLTCGSPVRSLAQCALNPTSPSVTICNPANGAAVTSPVTVEAGTTDKAHPVTAMILYVDNMNTYKVNASQLTKSVSLAAGKHNITVNAWDSSGAAFKSTVIISVSGIGTSPVSVAVSPSAATLAPGSTQQFHSTVLNASNTAVSWSVDGFYNGNTTVGMITNGGLYTAPSQPGTHHVVATSVADGTKSDTATVTVSTGGCTPASAPPSVTICSPKSGATVSSPVQISAVGNSATPFTRMQVYIDSVLKYQTTSRNVNASLAVAKGTHNLTVQFYNGAWIKRSENFTVGSGVILSPTNLFLFCVFTRGCTGYSFGTVTLSNLGNAALSIQGITITGNFSQTNNCGTSLGVGQSCTIAVRWPQSSNSIGELVVNDNASSSPQTVLLRGFIFPHL